MVVYGFEVNSRMYLSEEEDALRVLSNYLKTITPINEKDLGEVKEVSKSDLDGFFEEHGPLDVEYNLVESSGNIEDMDEYNKVDILFLHFHDSDRAWRYFNDENYQPSVITR